MSSPETIDVLNQALQLLRCSLPQFLRYSRPYVPAGLQKFMDTAVEVASGQEGLAERISDYVTSTGGTLQPTDFPIEFTALHDLSIDYIAEQSLRRQEQDMAQFRMLTDMLESDPAARSLIDEAIGMTRGHLESLQEIVKQIPQTASK